MWYQYQSNAACQGYAPLPTGSTGSLKWTVEVGPVAFASPVIGNDGTIYIGNLKAELVAVTADGRVRWKKTLAERGHVISASPVIDAAGNIYAITSYRAKVRDHRSGQTILKKEARSKLHCVSPDGTLRWTFTFPQKPEESYTDGFCLSAPRVYGTQNPVIFVPSFYMNFATNPRVELLAIDNLGNLIQKGLVADYPIPPIETTGGGIGDVFEAIWDFLNGVEFNPSGGPDLKKQFGWPQPSIAVSDFGRVASQPIIIIDDNYKQLRAFRWINGQFVPLWQKPSNKRLRFTASPAIFLSSMVAAGQQDGSLELYDLVTGQELWKPWYKASSSLQSPPACFLSQIFLVSGSYVIALNANASLINKTEMNVTTISSPVISADRVFVNGGDALYSFSLDLKEVTKNTEVQGGVSSPAIADDGTIYVVDRNKTLWAFS